MADNELFFNTSLFFSLSAPLAVCLDVHVGIFIYLLPGTLKRCLSDIKTFNSFIGFSQVAWEHGL